MKINDYIIRGGENLNAAPLKTLSFPTDAERIFNEWHSKLGKDDEEKENYFELPVNDQNRLFIRSFYVEKAGNRPICFYVGLLIPKTAYIEAKDYYCMHKGLCSVSFNKIQEAAKASFLPIEFTTDWPIPRTPIGLDFQQLSKMRLYGDKEFSSNINQMCFSISVNNIDDWFSRLFIAVNPYRLSRSFHVVVSREQPRPPMPDDKQKNTKAKDQYQRQYAVRKQERATTSSDSDSNTPASPKSKRVHWVFLLLFVLALIGCLYHFIHSWSEFHALQAKNENLKKTNEELSAACTRLDGENHNKDREIKRLLGEIDKRDKKIRELEKQPSRFGGILGINDSQPAAKTPIK